MDRKELIRKSKENQKKIAWSLAGGLLFCVLMGLGWRAYQQAEAHKQALKAAVLQLKDEQTQYHRSQGLMTSESLHDQETPLALVSVLTDQAGQVLPDLERLQTDRIKSLAKEKDVDLVTFTYQSQETSLANVKDVKLLEKHYRKTKTSYELLNDESPSLAQLYLKKDGTRFTLDDFLANKDNFVTAVSEKLSASGWTESDIKTSVEQIRKESATLPITLTAHSILLPLGSKPTSVEMAFSEIYESIHADLLTGEARVAYDAYVAEKAVREAQEAYEAALRARGPNPVATGKVVALTFDDGPDPNTTRQLQKILRQNNVRATFFILGQKVAGNEEFLCELRDEGHQLANHSWSHPDLTKLTPDQVHAEVANTQQAILNATGTLPTILRPPYGASNARVAQAAGLPIVNWTVDTLDWQSRNPVAILNQVKAQVHLGAVILMHDIHQTSVDAVQSVIDYLKAEGYSFVTVNELYGY